jgi:hypothetical protein
LLEERLRFEALLTFEPLFTTKAEGLDIRLAIVRTIVDAHGGGLGAANNQQGGAAAHFTLPAGCGIGSWGGQRPSMADYVMEMGATRGRAPPEGANVAYALGPDGARLRRQRFSPGRESVGGTDDKPSV